MARILLIDDDEAVRTALRRTLERFGHVIHEAPEGGAALRMLRDDSVDLIITDIIMPGMEGIETIRALRRDHPEVPVIAISGGGRFRPDSYLDIAASFGAVHTLSKPFEPEELLTAVDSALGTPIRA